MAAPRSGKTDLLRGTLDLLILRTLALQPLHGVAIADRIAVPFDDMGQHDSNCQSVRGAIPSGERVGACVRGAQHRVRDGHTRFMRSEQHGPPRGDVIRRIEDTLVVRRQKPPCGACEQVRSWRACGGDE